MSHLKNLAFVAILACIVLPGCGPQTIPEASQPADERTCFLVHLDCNPQDQDKVTRILHFADVLCSAKSRTVLFIDLKAVQFASKDVSQLSEERRKELDQFFQRFQGKGGKVLLCPHCAVQYGVDAESLRSGIQMTTKAELDEITEQADMVYSDESSSPDFEQERKHELTI